MFVTLYFRPVFCFSFVFVSSLFFFFSFLLFFYCCFFFFFFSSRRRHTRYIGDWSSDVCSSDLDVHQVPAVRGAPAHRPGRRRGRRAPGGRRGGPGARGRRDGAAVRGPRRREIGRASCRERVESSGVAG